eukprot:COSAG02_NODE_19082_length_901_cov_0.879052_1_plen_177_part_10
MAYDLLGGGAHNDDGTICWQNNKGEQVTGRMQSERRNTCDNKFWERHRFRNVFGLEFVGPSAEQIDPDPATYLWPVADGQEAHHVFCSTARQIDGADQAILKEGRRFNRDSARLADRSDTVNLGKKIHSVGVIQREGPALAKLTWIVTQLKRELLRTQGPFVFPGTDLPALAELESE